MVRIWSTCVLLVYCIMNVPEVAFGLECYACADTSVNNKCEQYGTYEEAVKADKSPLIKNCTVGFDELCYIETYSDRGNTISHIRDCGNDTRYSFTDTQLDVKKAYERLKSLSTTNETRCIWDGKHQVCLTKCTEDLCNGPQLDNGSVGARGISGLYLLVMGVLTMWKHV